MVIGGIGAGGTAGTGGTGSVSNTSSITMTKQELIAAAAAQGITIPQSELTKETYNETEIKNMISSYSDTRDTVATLFCVTNNVTADDGEVWNITQAKDYLLSKYPVTGTATYQNSFQQFEADKNPEIPALEAALNGGALEELASHGLSRSQIVDAIHQAYPNAGIENVQNSDKYSIPNGHGAQASGVYSLFRSKLTQVTGSTPEIAQLEKDITKFTNQLNLNISNIKSLDSQIKSLKEAITEIVEEAIAEVEDLEEEGKREAKSIVIAEVNAYDGTTPYSSFEKSLEGKLKNVSDVYGDIIASAVTKMTRAEYMYTSINNLVGSISSLNEQNTGLRSQIANKEAELAIKRAELANQGDNANLIDPIGFNLQDNVRIDFFIDLDGDEALSNETEFLGAVGGWAEMTALDKDAEGTDGHGTVDYDELVSASNGVNLSDGREGKLKAVQTELNADGTIKEQKIVDISEIFSQGDSINLDSYKANGNIFATNNVLQGTFDVVKDGTTHTNAGYQTLDTLDWLDNNYKFSDKEKGIGRFAEGEIQGTTDEEEILASNYSFSDVEDKLTQGWAAVGIDRNDIAQKIQKEFTIEQKMIAEDKAKAFGTTVKETGSTWGTSSTKPVTYDEFNPDEGEWKNLFENLYNSHSKSTRQSIRSSLLSKLKNSNFSDSDVARCLARINEETCNSAINQYTGGFGALPTTKSEIISEFGEYNNDIKDNFLTNDKYKDRDIEYEDLAWPV